LVNELPIKDKSHIIIVRVILIAACAFLISSSFALWLATEGSSEFRANLRDRIRKELIREDSKRFTNAVDAIYLLGGPQRSLEYKFKTAAELYHKGISRKVIILSRPGITEYSPDLQRNLTNDEWSILQLERFGVPKQIIEPISMKEGFFGTFTEARAISNLVKNRDYQSIVLISSSEHTRRVKISFENFLQHNNIKIYVQSSDEKGSLGQHLIELIKLKIYEYFLV